MNHSRTPILILCLVILIGLNASFVAATSPTAPEITQLAPETYSTSVKVNWTAASSSAGIYLYFLQKSTDSNFINNVTTTTLNGNILSYTYNGLLYDNLYYFRIYARSNDGTPANMNPYDPVTNPNGVRWSAITRTECLPLPANNYSLPAISTISNSSFYSQNGFYYTNDHNPTVSWTNPTNWPPPTEPCFTKLAASSSSLHSMVLKSGGTVWGWGNNGYGELGLGDGTKSTNSEINIINDSDGGEWGRCIPGQVKLESGAPFTNAVALSSGQYHTIALKNDGTVWGWGYNGYGMLGDGTTTDKKNPVQVKLANGTTLTNIIAVAAGGCHSIALKNDGTVWGWGGNSFGQLGNGTTTDQKNPVQVKLANGTAFTNVIAIAGASYFTIALKNDGTVWAWGQNSCGQLGNGTNIDQKNPVQVKLANGTALTNVIAIAGGTGHAIALKNDKTVWTWGDNLSGNLGDGTTTNQKNPVQVKLANGTALTNINAIAGGGSETIALRNDGTVWTWGFNGFGQLGNGFTIGLKNPVQVLKKDRTALTNVSAITGGDSYVLALDNYGTIWSWGRNNFGQLGTGDKADHYYATKIFNPIVNQIRITQYNEQPKTYIEYPAIYFNPGANSVQTNWNLQDGKYILFVGIAVNGSIVWSPGYKLGIVTLPPPVKVNSITAETKINNGNPVHQATVTVEPVTGVAGYKFYRRKNGGVKECLTPTSVTGTTFIDTNLSAHDRFYEYGYSTYHATGVESAIKWGDSQTVVSPGQYAPKAYIPNLPPNPTVSGPRSIVVYTDASFTLYRAKDQENDQLEYRLYLRKKGESTWTLNQTWVPATDNETKTTPLEDRNNYEWYLTCIETDPNIIDKQEVTVIPCSSLYIDIHYPLPLCSNDFDQDIYDNMWGTKGQPLTFQVECNPLAHFQTFAWDFGDGSPVQSGQQTTHIYHNLSDPANPYQIIVTATDDQNIQYHGTASIKIINTPKGRLYADETWTVSHNIQADVTVPASFNLTIEMGTQVQVNYNSVLLISGNLQVRNGANLDGTGSALWEGIWFIDAGTGTINGAAIGHAVRGVACTSSGQVTIQNSTFSFNDTGIHCYSGDILVLGCSLLDNLVYGIKEDNNCQPLLQNCIFRGNGIPYYDWQFYDLSIDQLNTAPNIGNQFQ